MSGVFGRVCRHWIEGLAAGLAVACIAALLARVSWVAELVTHVRLQDAVHGTGTLRGDGFRRARPHQQISQGKPGWIRDALLFRALFAQIDLLHLAIDDLGQKQAGLLVAQVTLHCWESIGLRTRFQYGRGWCRIRTLPASAGHKGVPESFTISRNLSINLAVTGPGLPSPIGRPSSFTAGMISAAVPVRKHSSAV